MKKYTVAELMEENKRLKKEIKEHKKKRAKRFDGVSMFDIRAMRYHGILPS